MINDRYPISYRDIQYSQPYDLRRSRRRKKANARQLKAWQTVLFLFFVMLFFYTVLPYLLYATGLGEIGMVLAEQVYLLACSVLFVFLMRADRREVFPLRRPRAGGIGGVVIMTLGSVLLSEGISYLILFFASDEVMEFSDSMGGSLTGIQEVLFLLLASVLPAICEEALNRGVVLNGLKNSIPNQTVVIVLSGVLFGLSHLYPYRMIVQSIVGCFLAWLVLKTHNMVYSALYHFLYNGTLSLFSGLASLVIPAESAGNAASAGTFIDPVTVGIGLLFYGILSPVLLYTGCYLVRCAEGPKKTAYLPEGFRSLLKILVPTGIIIITGIAFIIAGITG